MTLDFLFIVGLAGIVTLGLKSSFIEGQNYVTLPPRLNKALEFVPPAVLCSLIVPAIFKGDTGLVQEFGQVAVDPRPIATILAAIAFFATKRTIPTLTAGMISLYLVYWLQL
jgi:branched-subunit amino acid transport protein